MLSLDGKPMENGRQFRINVYSRGAGEQVMLDVRRGERTLPVRVAGRERPTGTARLSDVDRRAEARPSTRDLSARSDADSRRDASAGAQQGGAVVVQVLPTAPYRSRAALMPGDVIYSLNGRPSPTAKSCRRAAAALAPASAGVLQIEREGC